MADLNTVDDPGSPKRRSTRVVQAVPIIVSGADALGQSFKERTSTVMVNCHGCKYQSKHYVPKNSRVSLEIPRQEVSAPMFVVRGRVVWVQRPRTVRELFQIGVEFEIAGNYWGIAFPPEDWYTGATGLTGDIPAPAVRTPIGLEHAETSRPLGTETKLELVPPAATSHSPSPELVHSQPAETAMASGGASILGPTPADLAKEMERVVAEAKHSLHQVARYESRTAVSEEIEATRTKIDAQLKETIEHAVQTSISRVSEQALQVVAQQSALQTASIVENARAATERGRAEIEAQLRQSLEAAIHENASQAAEEAVRQAAKLSTSQTLHQAVEDAVSKAIATRAPVPDYFATDDAARERSEKLRREVEEAAASARAQSLEQVQNEAGAAASRLQNEVQSSLDGASQKLDEQMARVSQAIAAQAEQDVAARERSEQLQREVEEAAARARAQSLEQIQHEAGAVANHWQSELQSSLDVASQKLNEQLARVSQAIIEQAEHDITARNSNLRIAFDDATAGAQKTMEEIKATVAQEQLRAEATKAEIQNVARTTLDEARQQVEQLTSSHLAEIGRLADSVVAEKAQALQPALEASAQQIYQHVADEITNHLAPHIDSARKVAEELAVARAEAENARQALQTRLQEAAEDSLRGALDRLKEQAEQFPAQFEEDLRARVKKTEEQLEAKTTETMHATFESLLKASDWYSKKAQSSMQSSLEKAVEHSTNALHERAAETSQKFTSELDGYSRNYVQHAQNQMEEAANDVASRVGERVKEAADTTAAGFADEVHRLASNTLSQFEDVSRESTERIQTEMARSQDKSLAEFRDMLDERVTLGVERASVNLELQLKPLIENWQAQRENQQRAWMEQVQHATDESIDHFKSRLENASNSWLLASATTLGQHSQAVIETLAQLAEKRLRDACSDVLAGMGDTIRQRLIGISAGIGTPDKNAETADKTEDKGAGNR
ncbi:MAG: hypothetical protein WA734_14705 [Candidatus Acidiferrales bacterium]